MFSLADAGHLQRLLATAGFREISVTRETREHSFASFADYWAPIEVAPGSLPQAYRALPDASRQAVREEVRTRLAPFEVNGRLVTRIEMLIGLAGHSSSWGYATAPNKRIQSTGNSVRSCLAPAILRA